MSMAVCTIDIHTIHCMYVRVYCGTHVFGFDCVKLHNDIGFNEMFLENCSFRFTFTSSAHWQTYWVFVFFPIF